MQAEELKELYKERTGKAPSDSMARYIDGLKVREVAKIWSMMGGGEDFIGALTQTLEQQLKKLGEADVDMKSQTLDHWVAHFEELKARSPTSRSPARKPNGPTFENATPEAPKEEATPNPPKPPKPLEEMTDLERKAYEDALAAEKLKQEAAALEARKAALRAQIAARQAAAKEADAAAAQSAQTAVHQDPEPAPEMDEEFGDDDYDDESEDEPASPGVTVPVTVVLNSPDEQLGLKGVMAVGKTLRALELIPGGACERAGMRPYAVVKSIDGHPVTTKEDIVTALDKVRAENRLEFVVVTEPPLSVEQLDEEMERLAEQRAENARKKVAEALKNCHLLLLDFYLVGARHVTEIKEGKSRDFFCEVKLRTVTQDGKVGPDHPNPQKTTTKTVKGNLNPDFDHSCRFVCPPTDCIRVSMFANKKIGKDNKGRVDLVLSKIIPQLNPGGKALVQSYPLVDDHGKMVGGHLDIALRVKGYKNKE